MKIPSLRSNSVSDMRVWWNDMLAIGLYINPDDCEQYATDIGDNVNSLTISSINEVSAIYDRMFRVHDESLVYETGVAAWYESIGYGWNEQNCEWCKLH